jgi:high-affinity nickel-transport protein
VEAIAEARSTQAPDGSRWQRFRHALTPAEWRRAAGLALAILLLHVVGFGLLIAFVAPQHFHLGDGAIFGVGLGLTAYTLGLRHAFDADHIGAIDNTTRKLQTDGQRPLGVGFFFSLGHSTVVLVLAVLISIGIRGLTGAVSNDASELHTVTGVIGPSVSGLFLWTIGVLNLLVLISIIRIFRRMRRGDFDERELEHELDNRGFMNRFYKNASNAITKSWQMYPLGFLFGLGFDTATEIALLATAGAAAAGGLPFYAILALPILFAAGMCLMDTLDGAFMNFAYGWAFAQPIRKIFYNITVTSLSVIVALVIGTIELISVLSDRFSLTGQPWDFVNSLNLDYVGYVIVGLFVVTWVLALSIWHFGRIEEKWQAGLRRTAGLPARRE